MPANVTRYLLPDDALGNSNADIVAVGNHLVEIINAAGNHQILQPSQ
jgi:hypothetical protein